MSEPVKIEGVKPIYRYVDVRVNGDEQPIVCPGCGHGVKVRLTLQVQCADEHAEGTR